MFYYYSYNSANIIVFIIFIRSLPHTQTTMLLETIQRSLHTRQQDHQQQQTPIVELQLHQLLPNNSNNKINIYSLLHHNFPNHPVKLNSDRRQRWFPNLVQLQVSCFLPLHKSSLPQQLLYLFEMTRIPGSEIRHHTCRRFDQNSLPPRQMNRRKRTRTMFCQWLLRVIMK